MSPGTESPMTPESGRKIVSVKNAGAIADRMNSPLRNDGATVRHVRTHHWTAGEGAVTSHAL